MTSALITTFMFRLAAVGISSIVVGWVLLAGSPSVVPLAAQSVPSAQSQWDGIYTAEQAARGAVLYAQNCAVCHGAELTGTILAPSLTGPIFTAKWNERSMGALFDLIQETMPLNSMTHLGAPQNAEVLAFMLQRGQAPPGRQELASRAEALQSIKFLVRRP
jgi:mono/diheme cytochrome c family protein